LGNFALFRLIVDVCNLLSGALRPLHPYYSVPFGIELTEVEGSSIKIPVHSRVAIQCRMKEYHEVGDHYLYICDVEQVYGNEDEEALFAWNGYRKVAPAKLGE